MPTYSNQSVVGGATAKLRVRGGRGLIAMPGLFSPGEAMPGQVQTDISGKFHFKSAGGTDVKTVMQGDVIGIEFDVADGTNAGFALPTNPTTKVTRADGTVAQSAGSMEYQGAGVYYGSYQTSTSDPLGFLTIQSTGTLPDGLILVRTENVEIVAAEAA